MKNRSNDHGNTGLTYLLARVTPREAQGEPSSDERPSE